MRISISRTGLSIVLGLCLLLAGMTGPGAASEYWPTRAWKTSTPEQQGIDSLKLANVLDHILTKKLRVHSILVIRSGNIVLDVNFYPFQANGFHDLASVTKAITATVTGIAVDKGFIKSEEQLVLDFFTQYKIANLDQHKKEIRVQHLLSMRDGFQCTASPSEVTLMQMIFSPNWVQFMLDLPMAAKPGTRYLYNSGAVHLLSAIITRATGMSAFEFGKKHLFGPLGISDIIWPIDPQGKNNLGFGDLRLRPHDLAKIGYLYLKKGIWENKRILSKDWIAKATTPYSRFKNGNGYGYQWVVRPDGSFAKSGRGGQLLDVIPHKNMVIVIHGAGIAGGSSGISRMFVQAANGTGEPLPPNPKACAALQAKIKQVCQKPKLKPVVSPLPEIASLISGKIYRLEPNLLGVTYISITFLNAGEGVLTFDVPPQFDRNPQNNRVGFDGIPRFSPGRYGLPSATLGKWVSDSSMVVDINGIGNNLDMVLKLDFAENKVTGTIKSDVFQEILLRGQF